MTDKTSYAVGYGRPPAEHRFKPGRCPNPKGRPRKPSRSLTERQLSVDILRVLEASVRLKRGGKVVKISRLEAVLEKLVAKALNDHGPSMRFVLKLHETATARLNSYHPELRIVQRWETEMASMTGAPLPDETQAHAEFFSRRTKMLIGLHDEARDPYVRNSRQRLAARQALENDRIARGIFRARVSRRPDGSVAIADPAGICETVVIDPFVQIRLLQNGDVGPPHTTVAAIEYLEIGRQSCAEVRAMLDDLGLSYELESAAE